MVLGSYKTPTTSLDDRQIYTWYMDEDMTVSAGSSSSVSAELLRLRMLHPANIFSSAYTLGLTEYEWGEHPYYATVVIFSDL